MHKNKRLLFTIAFILNFCFSYFTFARCADNSTDDQFGYVKGRITKIDYVNRKLDLAELKGLEVTDSTLNVIINRRTRKNIEKMYEGFELLLLYNKSSKLIEKFWPLQNIENEYDLANFIYIQEKHMDKIIQSYHLGEVDIINIHEGNQVHLIINNEYINTLSNSKDNKELEIITTVRTERGQLDISQLPKQKFLVKEITSARQIIYDLEDLGLKNGDKIKITATLYPIEQGQKDSISVRRILSSRELRITIKNYGFITYSSETISFVRDSFKKNWKPAPGVSATIGYNIFTSKKSKYYNKIFAAIWNAIEPRFGVDLTLLDFDALLSKISFRKAPTEVR